MAKLFIRPSVFSIMFVCLHRTNHCQAGLYVGRVLHQDKPADLSNLQATKFDWVINRKVAMASTC
jgi:hypothetical protein